MKITNCINRTLLASCNLKGINYQMDTYIGCEHYCYYCYALKYAETNWLEEIKTHKDIQNQLNKELATISPQTIYMGYHSDPYQPVESELYQTRKALETLSDKGFSASILTKSNLVVRDIDILAKMPDANVSISVAFNDDKSRKRFEANTVNTDARINALRLCKDAGIKTSALICPMIPNITNTEKLIAQLVGLTDKIWIYPLSLQDENDASYRNIIRVLMQHSPEEAHEIKTIISNKEHSFWLDLRKRLEITKRNQNIDLSINL